MCCKLFGKYKEINIILNKFTKVDNISLISKSGDDFTERNTSVNINCGIHKHFNWSDIFIVFKAYSQEIRLLYC